METKFFLVFIFSTVFLIESIEDFIRFRSHHQINFRLCSYDVAFDCMVKGYPQTECVKELDRKRGYTDPISQRLHLNDSLPKPFTDCIDHAIRPLTKGNNESNQIYISEEETGSSDEKEKFINEFQKLSSSNFVSNLLTHCRLRKITMCFYESQCIMKSYYKVMLKIFDDCENEATNSKNIEKLLQLSSVSSSLMPPPSSQFTPVVLLDEKTMLLNVIGHYSMKELENLRRYAQLDSGFKRLLCEN